MQYKYFEFKNYKGIGHIKFELDSHPRSRVFTLVGLNESGKTTILEAINYFKHSKVDLTHLDLTSEENTNIHNLIPVAKKSNFNGIISITACMQLDIEDEKAIKTFCQDELNYELANLPKEIAITQAHHFVASKHEPNKDIFHWLISLSGKKKGQRKVTRLDFKSEEMRQILKFVKDLMPPILYFPNFLFDFPDRIYLDDSPVDLEKQKYYKQIVQDILDALNNGTDLVTHLLNRIKSGNEDDSKSLKALLLEMQRDVTKSVFGSWNKIFARKNNPDRKIVIDYQLDEQERAYLEFKLEDGDGLFEIRQRSLGFRWFFVFLLFTQYRAHRKNSPKNTLFLLDEPASNLHQSAQVQLLNSFDKLSEKCQIVYTTHSHHLINPSWLESTFVVKNLGLNYENDDAFNTAKTDVKIDLFRVFAVNNPSQVSYYQPILDVLDHVPSKLEFIPDIIVTEGKNDFYLLKYIYEVVLGGNKSLNLVPSTSSSNFSSIVSLYLGWNRKFVLLLDADKEGKKQKEKYLNDFGEILHDKIFLLSDVDGSWDGMELEDLIEEKNKLDIQSSCYPSSTVYNKTHFNRSIQEQYLKNVAVDIGTVGQQRFRKLIDFLKDTFD